MIVDDKANQRIDIRRKEPTEEDGHMTIIDVTNGRFPMLTDVPDLGTRRFVITASQTN